MDDSIAKATNRPQSRKRLLGAGAVIAALALVFSAWAALWQGEYLVLYNIKQDKVAYVAPLGQNEEFSVSYTHSVNKSNVDEAYQLRGQDIYLVRLTYSAFGAGMTTQYDAEGGKSFYLDDQGRMVIAGYDTRVTDMVYNIAVIADHILHIKGQEIHLNTIGRPKDALRFQIRSLTPLEAWRLRH